MTLARPRAAALNNTRPPLAGAVIVNEGGAQDLDDLLPALRFRGWVDVQGPAGTLLLDGRDWRGRVLRLHVLESSDTPAQILSGYRNFGTISVAISWLAPTFPAGGGIQTVWPLAGYDSLRVDDAGRLYLVRSTTTTARQWFLDIQASPLIEAPTHELV